MKAIWIMIFAVSILCIDSIKLKEEILDYIKKHNQNDVSQEYLDTLLKYDDFLVKETGGARKLLLHTKSRIAAYYRRLQRYGDAEKYYKDAVALAEQLYGKFNENTGIMYDNIAAFYNGIGEKKLSLEYSVNAYAILAIALGETHKETIYSKLNYGIRLVQDHKYTDGCPIINEIFKNNMSAFADKNEMAMIFEAYGICARKQKNFDEGITYHKKALELYDQVFGAGNIDSLMAEYNLGMALYESNKLKEGLAALIILLGKIQRDSINKYHSFQAEVLIGISQIYKDLRDFRKEREFLLQAQSTLLSERMPNKKLLGIVNQKLEQFRKDL